MGVIPLNGAFSGCVGGINYTSRLQYWTKWVFRACSVHGACWKCALVASDKATFLDRIRLWLNQDI